VTCNIGNIVKKFKIENSEIDFTNGSTTIGIGKKGIEGIGYKRADVFFTKEKKENFPYGAVGKIGLNPQSTFIQSLKTNYNFTLANFSFTFNSDFPKDVNNIFSNQSTNGTGLIYWMVDIPQDIPLTQQEPTATTWRIENFSVKFDQPPSNDLHNSLRLLTENDFGLGSKMCIMPSLNGFFIFKNQELSTKFSSKIFQKLCNKNSDCPITENITKIPNLLVKFGESNLPKEFRISSNYYLYKGDTNWMIGNSVNENLFVKGNNCEGANFAVGKNFFDRFTMNVVEQNGKWMVGITKQKEFVKNRIIDIVILGVVVSSVLVGIIVFFRLSSKPTRRTIADDYNDGTLDETETREIVAEE
jgi:hypothetical protein